GDFDLSGDLFGGLAKVFVLGRLLVSLLRQVVGHLVSFVVLRRGLQRVAHLVERDFALIGDLHQVPTPAFAEGAVDGADFQVVGVTALPPLAGLVRLLLDPADVAPLLGRGVLRIAFRDCGEIFAGLRVADLARQFVYLGFDRAFIGGGQHIELDDAGALFILLARLILLFKLFFGDRNGLGDFFVGDEDVLDLARPFAGFEFIFARIVVGAQLLLGGVELRSDLLPVDGGVNDLDLGVVALVFLFDFAVGDLRRRDDKITNFARGDVIPPLVLVLLDVQAAQFDSAQIFISPNERALLVTEGAYDRVGDFAVGAGQVKLAPLLDHQALRDQLIEGLL